MFCLSLCNFVSWIILSKLLIFSRWFLLRKACHNQLNEMACNNHHAKRNEWLMQDLIINIWLYSEIATFLLHLLWLYCSAMFFSHLDAFLKDLFEWSSSLHDVISYNCVYNCHAMPLKGRWSDLVSCCLFPQLLQSNKKTRRHLKSNWVPDALVISWQSLKKNLNHPKSICVEELFKLFTIRLRRISQFPFKCH